jgi:hypothetical protein
MDDDGRSSVDAIIDLYKQDVDWSLIRRNFTLTVEQRFDQLMALQRFAEELRRAGREARLRDRLPRAP